MQSGVLIRHLVLPGHTCDSERVIEYLYSKYGDSVYLSIMSQYTPIKAYPYPELNRCIDEDEYAQLIDYAIELGVSNAFIQEGDAADESFIPEFES